MLPYWIARIFRIPMKSSRRQRRAARRAPQKRFRPWLEALEERILLSGGLPADIVVGRTLLSRNFGDFEELHDLVHEAQGCHPGVLVIRQDNPKKRKMKSHDIVRALRKLEAAACRSRTSTSS